MSRRLPAITAKKVIRALERHGFFVHHVSGSHYILKHPGNPILRVTIPYHHKDLKRSTLNAIIKQTGLTVEEFLDLL